MKTITIKIIDLKDIYYFFVCIFDKIEFYFSKPKYKIGHKINMGNWGKNLKITSIYRDWRFCDWGYSTDKGLLDFSEALMDFYNKEK